MAEGPASMDGLAQLRRLVDHLAWAHRRTVEAVREHENEGARRLLAHVAGAERVWLRRIETGDSSDLEIWPDLPVERCEEQLEAHVEAFRDLLDSLTDEELRREVSYRNSEGRAYETPLGDILLQLVLHAAHHRGQIALRLRDGGNEPVNTDFITFAREQPPDGT